VNEVRDHAVAEERDLATTLVALGLLRVVGIGVHDNAFGVRLGLSERRAVKLGEVASAGWHHLVWTVLGEPGSRACPRVESERYGQRAKVPVRQLSYDDEHALRAKQLAERRQRRTHPSESLRHQRGDRQKRCPYRRDTPTDRP